MEETFLKDNFNPAVHKDALVWALKQKKRIRAMIPDISSRKIVEKILYRMDGDVRNAVKVLIQQDPTWDKFVEAFSEVCKDTTVIRKPGGGHNPRRNAYQDKPFNRESRPPVATTSSTRAQPSFS